MSQIYSLKEQHGIKENWQILYQIQISLSIPNHINLHAGLLKFIYSLIQVIYRRNIKKPERWAVSWHIPVFSK